MLTGPDASRPVLVDDSVSTAMPVVMEWPGPPERVAFVLHDVFEVPFERIAVVTGTTAVVPGRPPWPDGSSPPAPGAGSRRRRRRRGPPDASACSWHSRLFAIGTFDVDAEGRILTLHQVINPEKLGCVPPTIFGGGRHTGHRHLASSMTDRESPVD